MACVAAVSDLHLGIGIFSDDEDHRLTTLKKAVQIGAEHDLLLVPANLFAIKRAPSRKLISHAVAILEKSPVPVIINSSSEENFYNSLELPENIHAFSGQGEFTSKGNLYSINCVSADEPAKLATIQKSSEGKHLVLVKTSFDPLATGLNPSLIKKLDHDFYFFGGRNEFRVFRYTGTIFGLFPGAAEPASLSHTGDTYAVSVTFSPSDPVSLKRYTINTIRIATFEKQSADREWLEDIISKVDSSTVVCIRTANPLHESLADTITALHAQVFKLFIVNPGKDLFFDRADACADASVRSQILRMIANAGDELDYAFLDEMISFFDKEKSFPREVLCDYLNA